MHNRLFILMLLVNIFCFSQTSIDGFVFDKQSKEPLPYATIKIIGDINYYSITNENGKFEISNRFTNDTIEVRFLGFYTKKIALSYFKKNSIVYLKPNVYALKTVVVLSAERKKDYAYELLNSLIEKYGKEQLVTKSKAFLTLSSSARGIPIEIIEGFYNGEQSLAKGIVDLKIKSGRFGQNRAFPFYSLNNTDILKDFQLFKRSNQILPKYPGNLKLNAIKNKYEVKIEECISCDYEDMSISFVPKKFNGHLFSGNIIFNKEALIIKKINLECTNPKANGLSSIIEHDEIVPKEIKLTVNFNPLDYDKIQSLNFKFSMFYNSPSSKEIIQSNSFLYFYDYNMPFVSPYFTNQIEFKNDYDKIIALQASEEFWSTNYQFPKSFSEERATDFFRKYGYLINYDNTIPSVDIKHTQPSVISWDKDKRLQWNDIKQNVSENLEVKYDTKNKGDVSINNRASRVYHSTNEFSNDKPSYGGVSKEFNFSYMLDHFIDEKQHNKFITRTIFDRNSSFCVYGRTINRLVYVNLVFDIYEYFRKTLEVQGMGNLTYEELKKMCNEKFKEATLTINKMQKETNYGLNFQSLIKWNNNLKKKLNIDNIELITNKKPS